MAMAHIPQSLQRHRMGTIPVSVPVTIHPSYNSNGTVSVPSFPPPPNLRRDSNVMRGRSVPQCSDEYETAEIMRVMLMFGI